MNAHGHLILDNMAEIDKSTNTQSTETPPAAELNALPAERILNVKSADLLDDRAPVLQNWAVANVWNPIVNTLAIDTHNAVSSSINDLSRKFGGSKVLNDWERAVVPAAKPLSSEWLAQNVAGGLAMVVPYGIAAVATKGALNKVAGNFAAEGATAHLLSSRSTATILGASAYDFLKKPLENETRLGNAAGAAVGFSMFEAGNHLSKGQSGVKLFLARALTGSIGATSHLSTAHLISNHSMPEADKLWNAALSGAVMNNALPAFQDKLSNFISKDKGAAQKAAEAMLAVQTPARLPLGDNVVRTGRLETSITTAPEGLSPLGSALAELAPRELSSGAGVQKWRSILEASSKSAKDLDLSSVPGREMPDLLHALSKSNDSKASSLANRLSIEALYSESPAQIQALSRDMITTGLKHPELVSNSTLRSWLDSVPERDGSTFGANRKAVVESLSTQQLAEIIFADKTLAEKIASSKPELVRTLGQEQLFTGPADSAAAQQILRQWAENKALTSPVEGLNPYHDKVSFKLIEELAAASSRVERQNFIKENLQQAVSGSSEALPARIEAAVRAASGDVQLMADLAAQMKNQLSEQSGNSYQRRMEINAELGRLSRQEKIPTIDILDPRMKAVELPVELSTRLRNSSEQALLDGKFESLLAQGELAKSLPDAVSSQSKLALDLVVEVRRNPEFANLSPKDQVNLLWASLLSRVGDKPAVIASGHDMSSANIASGILRSLNYPPERIQRINALISRQSDTAAGQSAQLRNAERAMDAAIAMRHPSALKQLQIMNEANARMRESTPADLASEMKRIGLLVNREGQKLPPAVPVLGTPIAPGFRVESLTGDYVVKSHATPTPAAFFKQLSTMETPDYAISATINTPKNLNTYQGSPLVALLAAAPEQISAVSREGMITGHRSNWADHVRMLTKPDSNNQALLAELNLRVQDAVKGETAPSSLRDLSAKLAQFDNLAELQALGKADARLRAHQALVQGLTHGNDGIPLPGTHEIKMVNPTAVGLGVVRGGKTVSLENFTAQDAAKYFAGSEPPSWMVPWNPAKSGILIPESLWRVLQEQKLPIVSLD